ncbi:MAG: glycoside hydrolase family 3 C-terminal domain-containing protein [bacterium]|nr:glycoside hydrolase family 3 C-terminal domain-containing protein [bacterium]
MNRNEAIEKAKALVSQMTVEELASQLRYDAFSVDRLGIPAYNWWNEALHGVAREGTATSFPQEIAQGASFDRELVHEIGNICAVEGRAKYNAYNEDGDHSRYKGLTFWSPNINIFRDPRWGRGQETYGEDPYLTAQLGCSFIKGMQQYRGGYMTAAACAKHFAVHSGPEELRHEFNAIASEKDLEETYLPAFEACVKEAEVEAVMGAYNRTNGEVCCASEYLMNKLRGEWGFEGHFVSDCWAVRDFHEKHHVTSRPEESVTKALKAGCDLNCGCTYQKIMNAYDEGMITREDIEKCAVRLFTSRYLLGMFDKSELDEISYDVVACDEHRRIAYRAAVEGTVLLKNSGILPIDDKKYRTIAVIGPNADSRIALIGNYYGTPNRYITVLDGITDECEKRGIRVHYSEGCHIYNSRPEKDTNDRFRLGEAKAAAKSSDLVILCLGLDSTLEGEQGDVSNVFASGDKLDLLLPESQRELMEEIRKTGKPFIVINLTGSAVDLSEADKYAEAVMQAWYPGAEGGRAIADMIFGKASPSGKLPVTFYRNNDPLPEFTDYSMKGRTYRYIEYKPLYEFGYGLNYGDTYTVKLEAENISFGKAAQNGIDISVTVKNDGKYDVSEVIQIYVKVKSDNEVPNKKLAAFERTVLKAGEEKTLPIHIDKLAFTTVNDEGERNADGIGAVIYAGCNLDKMITREI